MPDLDVGQVLEQYKGVPFVQRILYPEKYPFLTERRGSDTYKVTHKMSWGESEGKYYVFPTVDYVNGELKDLTKIGMDPFRHAIKNMNYIEFSSAEEADWFSKNYKQYWEK